MFTPLQRACSESKSSVAELLILLPEVKQVDSGCCQGTGLAQAMPYTSRGVALWPPMPGFAFRCPRMGALSCSVHQIGSQCLSPGSHQNFLPSVLFLGLLHTKLDFEGLLSTVTTSTQKKTFIMCPSWGIVPPRISLRGPKHALQSLSSCLF